MNRRRIVKRDGDVGYTASFPDFPSCAVAAPTVDHVIARAREALSLHIERLLEANHRIGDPTAADAIERGDALLLGRIGRVGRHPRNPRAPSRNVGASRGMICHDS